MQILREPTNLYTRNAKCRFNVAEIREHIKVGGYLHCEKVLLTTSSVTLRMRSVSARVTKNIHHHTQQSEWPVERNLSMPTTFYRSESEPSGSLCWDGGLRPPTRADSPTASSFCTESVICFPGTFLSLHSWWGLSLSPSSPLFTSLPAPQYFQEKFTCPHGNKTDCYGFNSSFENWFSVASMVPIFAMSAVNVWLQSK